MCTSADRRIVLDEPTSAFDKSSEIRLFNTEFMNSEKTIIFVTHNIELTSFADEVLNMKNGSLEKVKFNHVENKV